MFWVLSPWYGLRSWDLWFQWLKGWSYLKSDIVFHIIPSWKTSFSCCFLILFHKRCYIYIEIIMTSCLIKFNNILPVVAKIYHKMEDEKKLSFADRVVPMRKSRRHSKRIPEVGSPTDFKHLLHIGTDSHHVDISNVPPQVCVYLIVISESFLLVPFLWVNLKSSLILTSN